MAYKVDPDNLELKVKLADVYLKSGDVDKAEKLARDGDSDFGAEVLVPGILDPYCFLLTLCK